MILAAWYHSIFATLFGFLALILMVVILLQRGKGVGLAGAFGGAGGHTAFGAKTGDVLTWATIVIAAALLTFSVVLNYVFRPLQPFAPTPAAAPVAPLPAGAPAETTPPADTEAPAESAPPGGGETPNCTWNPGDPATGLRYARQDIFGVDLG